MYGYIYLTTNLINNKKYIGQRKWNKIETIRNDKYIGSGKILKQAIKKYGKSNFIKEILFICNSKEELGKCEQLYILEYNAIEDYNFYNIHEGGYGGNTRIAYSEEEMDAFRKKMKTARVGYHHSEETKKKISESSKGENNANHLSKLTNEQRKEMSERFSGEKNPMYGKKLSKEHIQKLKDSHNGKFNYNLGKQMSKEQKDKISIASKNMWSNEENKQKWISRRIGETRSDDAKLNLSKGAYKRYNTIAYDNNIVIYQYDKEMKLIETYNGIDEYYKRFNTKTCRNLKKAVKEKNTFKNCYWEISSPSTIESTSLEEKSIVM